VSASALFEFLEGLDNQIMLDSPDCSFDRITKDLALVSTIDFFYPLCDDPYEQGRIGAANVLSDLYAAGVHEIRNGLMVLGVSTKMTTEEQNIVTKMMIAGFNDTFREAQAKITGGQTVFNEAPIIGGTAIGLVRGENPYVPRHAKPGDILVLTKPLAAQVIVNVNQYLKTRDEKWSTLVGKGLVKEDEILETYLESVVNMGRLNKNASKLMLKHGATASTDVTGFGILGHAENIAEIQIENVDFVLDCLPMYKGMLKLDNIVRDFDLLGGYTPETSGGLLIALPSQNVAKFMNELKTKYGEESWIVGRVEDGHREARLSDNVEVLEV
jgi:selenide,water dikinase